LETASLRVLLAIVSPVTRERLHKTLTQEPSVQRIEQATDRAQVAQAVKYFQPDIVLYDDRMLADSLVRESLSISISQQPTHLSLIMTDVAPQVDGPALYVMGVSKLNSPGTELVLKLHAAYGNVPARQRAQGIFKRVVTRGTRYANPYYMPTVLSQGEQTPRTLAGVALESPIAPENDRRHTNTTARVRLVELLKAAKDGQQHRHDSLTGLLTMSSLGAALRSLPQANYPAAVVVIQLWSGPDPSLAPAIAENTEMLRSIALGMKATVRQDDFLYRLNGTTFAILLPGIDALVADRPLRRLRETFSRFQAATRGTLGNLSYACGVGYWLPGLPPRQPFEQGWQAMLAERSAGGFSI
jgi:GGDEF domain-containing protein